MASMGEVKDNGYTPMIQQYLQIKAQNPDAILFFRLGDFYEMFFGDAELASRELEITLTSRDAGVDRAPMCGVPYHAADSYIARLINKGYKVAICEQLEDPRAAKGIVKRDVVRIITPGTVMDPNVLDEKQNNFIIALHMDSGAYGMATADASTGEFYVAEFTGRDAMAQLQDELLRVNPREIVWTEGHSPGERLKTLITRQIKAVTTVMGAASPSTSFISHHFLEELQAYCRSQGLKAASVAGRILYEYLAATQKCVLEHIRRVERHALHDYMLLDSATRRNLELTRNLRDGGKTGTLLAVLDFTLTAMGGRLLRRWVEQPLVNADGINARLEAVAELVTGAMLRGSLTQELKQIYDLERLIGKLAYGSANARDLLALKKSLAVLPALARHLTETTAWRLRQLAENIDTLTDVTSWIDHAIQEDPPFSVREGNLFKAGYHQELDELRELKREGKSWLASFEQRERERTGIKSLKVSFNKVFGYYIEVTAANLANVPDDYIRKQTLANAERYITPELKTYEDRILGAEEKIVNLEYTLFCELREKLLGEIGRIQKTARTVAELDVLVSLAEAASRYNYCKPLVDQSGTIVIRDGRHPVVERLLQDELFVPNDTHLDTSEHRLLIITGPNMAGKSTYMRQVALITLLAQMGSFVPASAAQIGVVDRIFTRVGATDDLVMGQSTFMVEMNEVANILQYATGKSLIILDEIGRGTSTFDGMSIAQSVIEYIQREIKAKTLFATHYHELTQLEEELTGVKNYSVAVKEQGEEIVFLRRIIPGGADRSYGIHVAQLAGLPPAVISRAKTILSALEQGAPHPSARQEAAAAREQAGRQAEQFSLFTPADLILRELAETDIMTLTPIEALNKLYQLQCRLKGGK